MVKRLQPYILVGNILLLLALLATKRGTPTELGITIALVLACSWSVWLDWQERQRDRLALEAMRRSAQPEIDRLIASGLLNESLWAYGRTGDLVEIWRDRPKSAIGDPSCRYSARSNTIRCAVNPCGPCEGCKDYAPIDVE